jgi:exodeoxyribonuclease V alpha subunit
MALKAYFKAVKEDGIENVVLLSPRKKEVLNSTSQFNVEIQKLVNSENLNNKFTYGKKTFLLDDRVIATKNSSETGIYNGFLGVVTEIRRDGFTAVFDDNIVGEYNKENIDEIELSGSISSHRSQGSQYLSVIVVLDMSSFMLLSNQMLYTSVSRGQKRVLVCAQPKAFDMCLRESENERNTYLRRMLEDD